MLSVIPVSYTHLDVYKRQAVTNKKFRQPFQWVAHKGGAFMHEFGAYAPNITGAGQHPENRRFFLLTF